MSFELPKLLFEKNALEPYISAETLEYHYGKHHKTYVDNLNQLIQNTPFAQKPLEEIMRTTTGPLFNNAGQAWNHSFYWECLTPHAQSSIPEELKQILEKQFGSIDQFKTAFKKMSVENFGSGWTWLVRTKDQQLEIVNTSNASNPLLQDKKPLLTCDVWEHAYYIDYRNARAKYVDNFFEILNWEFVLRNSQ